MKVKKSNKRICQELKNTKINNIDKKKVNNGGFPQLKKVLCSNCKETEFFVKFVIPSLAYSKKNNLGYWTGNKDDESQEWCNQCYRKLFKNKEVYWKMVASSKKRELFRSYLYDKHL